MLALLDKKTYADPKALDAACNQVFMVQAGIAALSALFSVFTLSLTFHHLMTIAMCGIGYFATREYNPESWKFLTAPSVFLLVSAFCDFFGYFFRMNFTFNSFVFTVVKTGLTVFQVFAFFILWRTLQSQSIQGTFFYLNFVVLNKDEVLDNKFKEKMGKAGKTALGKLASCLANKATSDQKFCRKMCTNMEKDIPQKMAEKGITASAKAVFSKRNYFVLKMTITAVDLPKMVLGKSADKEAGLAKSEKIRQILDKLPAVIKEEIEFVMNLVIAGGMVKNMPEKMVADMKEKAGMDVEVVGRTASEQADFFYELMQSISPVTKSVEGGEAEAEEEEQSLSAKDQAKKAVEKGKAKIGGLVNRIKNHGQDRENE